MKAEIKVPSRAIAAVFFLSIALSNSAFAGSKTDRVVQASKIGSKVAIKAAKKFAPIVRAGTAAYNGARCTGHEIGRWQSISRYKVDPGRCRW